jgi:hypothetical protein
MQTNKSAVVVVAGILCLVIVLFPVNGAAKRLAYSKNYGVEIFAEEQDSQWCRETLDLRLNGDAESSFETAKLQILISKLGKIIANECPEATSASIVGYFDDSVVYRAKSAKQEDWMLRAVPAAGEDPATEASSVAVSASDQVTDQAIAEMKEESVAESPVTTSAGDTAVASAPATVPAPAVKPAVISAERVDEVGGQVDSEAPEPGRPAPAAFKVNGWSPAANGQSIQLAGEVREYVIMTRDGTCGIRYSSINEAALVEFLQVDLEGVDCKDGYASGKGKATVKRSDGQLVRTLKGYFVQGYNIGLDLKGAPIVSRYISNRNAPSLGVFLGSDSERKIHYLAQLTASRDVWGNCRSMMVTAVTEDEDAFLDAKQIKPVVQQAGDLARDLCPNIRQIEFLALLVSMPLQGAGTDAQYFHVAATRTRNKDAWTYSARHAQNYVINRKLAAARVEKQRIAQEQAQLRQMEYQKQAQRAQMEYQKQLQQQQHAQQMQLDYQRLESADFASRVAFLHEAVQLDNPISAAARSLIRDRPVKVTVMVHIDAADGNKAETDRPSKVKLTAADALFEDEGWYIITGDLTADGTVDDSGFLVPDIAVAKATRCADGRCQEVDDVVTLVRARYQDADWSPGQ